ncbi:MAG: hypothetical protein J5629_01685 [Muribaculaceae bacterium]|nr:hypothetical protein [Muribaculaceae bacterium]
MKKSIILILSVLFCFSCFAQKSYVCIYGCMYSNDESKNVRLSGNIPDGFSEYYNYSNVGIIINQLASKGFIVEQLSGSASYGFVSVLMSKSASNESGAIEIIKSYEGEIKEVARYNLQGIPVNENTPGIQIVVYSNYTTKTVIVE